MRGLLNGYSYPDIFRPFPRRQERPRLGLKSKRPSESSCICFQTASAFGRFIPQLLKKALEADARFVFTVARQPAGIVVHARVLEMENG